MVSTKASILFTLAATGVLAVDPSQSVEIGVILSDAKEHLSEYMALITTLSIPPAVLEIGMALATATDDSYTTLYSEIDFNQVNSMVTELPWYSTRLSAELASALQALPTATASDSTSTSAGSSSATITSSPSSSSASSSEASSSATSSSAASSSAASSSAASSSAASSSTSITSQTSNGAGRVAFGMGAGCLGVAALLL